MSKPDFAGVFTSDWHIDSTRNIEDTAKCVDFVIAETIRRSSLLGPDVPFTFTHGGDGYRTFNPSPIETDVMHRTRALKRVGIESEIIVANHDLRESESDGSVHAFIDMKNLGGAMTVVEKPSIMPVIGKVNGIEQQIAYRILIPHIGKATLQRAGLTYPQMFKRIMDEMISQLPAGSRIIVVSHFFVKEAKVGPHDHIMDGAHLVPLASLQDPRLLAVFLGDIHKVQRLAEKPLVVYPGSIDRVDFGEAEDPKGFIYYEVYGSEIKIEFVPTPARRFLHIVADLVGPKTQGEKFFDVPDVPSAIQPWLETKFLDYEVKGAIVKLTIRCGPNQKSQIDDRKLTDVIVGLGAVGVRSVNFDVVTAENRRAPEITESLSPVAALEHWAGMQGYQPITMQSIVLAGKKLIGVEK